MESPKANAIGLPRIDELVVWCGGLLLGGYLKMRFQAGGGQIPEQSKPPIQGRMSTVM